MLIKYPDEQLYDAGREEKYMIGMQNIRFDTEAIIDEFNMFD